MGHVTSCRTGEAATGADSGIHRALTRLEAVLERNPGFGRVALRSAAESTSGLCCRTTEGVYTIEADLPAALGGGASAPTPTALLRAALASCLVIGYQLRAARRGVDLATVRVVVETDSALAGMLVPGSAIRPGFIEIRYHVEIETDAPPAAVKGLVDEADRLSPVLDALRANRLTRSLSIVAVER